MEMQLGSKIITTLQETVSVTGALVKLDHVKACMFFKTFGDPCIQERAQRWLCGSGLPGYEVGDPKFEFLDVSLMYLAYIPRILGKMGHS